MQADGRLFRVVLRFGVRQGMEEGFETTWRQVGAAIAAQPGVRSQWLLRSAEEPATYWIMSDWADERQFRAFERGAAHLEHRKSLQPYRADVSMTTMHIACHLAGPEREAAR
jgi:heme oxygenase (mycobilin-producing)